MPIANLPETHQLPTFDEDVFISYSRSDQDFARKLQDALSAKGRDVWVDWTGIPPAGDWLETIKDGIDRAQVFVLIVSPNSLQSKVCMAEEVRHALDSHKKIIPIVIADFSESQHVPEAHAAIFAGLQKLNYIFLRPGIDNFSQGIAKVIEALDTDLRHVQQHTEFLRLARNWDDTGRPSSRLLRGKHMENAENWLTGVGDKEPPTNDLQIEFIRASRAASRKRQRQVTSFLVFTFILVTVAAALAVWQAKIAREERDQKETQLARANREAGIGWLMRSRIADEAENHLEAAFCAARSLGFVGAGVEESLLVTEGNQSPWNLWNFVGSFSSAPELDVTSFPVLLRPELHPSESTEAYRRLDLRRSRPFIWNVKVGDTADCVAWSPDGQWIATLVKKGRARQSFLQLWNASSCKLNEEVVLEQTGLWEAIAMDWDQSGRRLAIVSRSALWIWNQVTHELNRLTEREYNNFTDIKWGPPGKETLATVNTRGSVLIWDAQSGNSTPLHTAREYSGLDGDDGGMSRDLAWSGGGDLIAASELVYGEIQILQTDGASEKKTIAPNGEDKHDQWGPLPGLRSIGLELAWGPDPNQLAIDLGDGTIQIWSIDSERPVLELRSEHGLSNLVWSWDGSLLAVSEHTSNERSGDCITIFDIKNDKRFRLHGHVKPVSSLAFSPDGSLLASTSVDGHLKVWDLIQPNSIDEATDIGSRIRQTLETRMARVGEQARSQDGKWLLTKKNKNERELILWDAQPSPESVTVQRGDTLSEIALSQKTTISEILKINPTIKNQDLVQLGEEILIPSGNQPRQIAVFQTGWVGKVEFSKSAEFFANLGAGEVRVWNLETKKEVLSHKGTDFAWNPQRNILALATSEGDSIWWGVEQKIFAPKQKSLILWDAATDSIAQEISLPPDPISGLVWSSDGGRVAAYVYDRKIRIWNGKTGAEVFSLDCGSEIPSCLDFHRDNTALISGFRSGAIASWNLESGVAEKWLPAHSGGVRAVEYLKDENALVSTGSDGTVKFWDLETKRWNYFKYIEEGYCHFDTESGTIVWDTELEFPSNGLPIFRNKARNKPKKGDESGAQWTAYLWTLQAQNWNSAHLFYKDLTSDQQSVSHQVVIEAQDELANQAGAALEHGHEKLAAYCMRQAQAFSAELADESQNQFYTSLGKAIAWKEIKGKRIEVVLSNLPDENAKRLVRSVVCPALADRMRSSFRHQPISFSDQVFEALDMAESWGLSHVELFEVAPPECLANAILATTKWDRKDAAQVALSAAAALKKNHPSWQGLTRAIDLHSSFYFFAPQVYYEGLALAKNGQYAEALEKYEEAMRMAQAPDRFDEADAEGGLDVQLKVTEISKIKAAIEAARMQMGDVPVDAHKNNQ